MPARLNPETNKGFRFKDRSGQRSGRLIFVRHLGVDEHRHHKWEAVCDCGTVTVTATPHKTKSCGCLQRETTADIQRGKALPKEVKRQNVMRNRARQRLRRRTDPVKAMQARLSRLHRHALRQVGAVKTSPTFEMLGYSAEQFVGHIERQFAKGMGWENMSLWQIDHVLPISGAKTIEDVVALNQLSNLRPMWATENNAKKNRRQSLL